MKILFLDDNEDRHRKFAQENIGHDIHHVRTAREAIAKLSNPKEWYDLVSLDHDLGDGQFVDSFGAEETGYTVAKYIVENWERFTTQVGLFVVHSYNPVGAQNIAKAIRGAGLAVIVAPFKGKIPMHVSCPDRPKIVEPEKKVVTHW